MLVMQSQPKHFSQNPSSVFVAADSMADGRFVLVNLVVVAAGFRLVAKEVNFLKLSAGDSREAERFVPAVWVNVEADHPTDGVSEIDIMEFTFEVRNHLRPHLVFLVELVKDYSLIWRALPADGANVHHSVAVLDESPALKRKFKVGDVSKHEADEALQSFLTELFVEGRFLHFNAVLDVYDAVLWKDVIELLQNLRSIQLLVHLCNVRSRDDSDCGERFDARVEEILEVLVDHIARLRQRVVDVEQQKNFLAFQ